MKTAFLVTPNIKSIPFYDDVDYIGVDAGCLKIIEQKLPIEFAIGDFDSMDKADLDLLHCEIIRHPVMKDETDSELACRICKERGYTNMILYGGISGRLDHTLANLRLMMYHYNELVCLDEKQKISVLKKGHHRIQNQYEHISFYAIEDTIITLEGFLWSLNNRLITPKDIYCTSNSLIEKEGVVIIDRGMVLCVQSNIK